MARERMECRSSRRRGGPGSCLPLCTRHLSTHRAYTFDEGRVGPVVCAWSPIYHVDAYMDASLHVGKARSLECTWAMRNGTSKRPVKLSFSLGVGPV